MGDYTLCTSEDCPVRDTCFRSRAKPDPFWQSYSDFSLVCNQESGFCDYIRNEDEENAGNKKG